MSFWRREVIDYALDQETRTQMAEQVAWIEREPANPHPYYHLAQLYRVAFRQDEALGLLLEAVRLDPNFADAHAALAEIYVVRDDATAAWHHAAAAELRGNSLAADLLRRYGVPQPTVPPPTPPPSTES
jgi:cytochrome c-type biogenesis protein CcmH/NrfG